MTGFAITWFRSTPADALPARSLLSAALLASMLAGIVGAGGLVFGDAVYRWVEARYGVAGRDRVVALQELIEANRDAPERDQLDRVNRFFNRVAYSTDASAWHRKDYWATPYEVLGVDAADCEDYAISKYFTLLSLGVPEERLRITYVKALSLDEAHMVLAYYPAADAEPLILDNLTAQIEPAGQRSDLIPVYSFNGADLWLAMNRGPGEKVGDADRLSRWTDYQARLMRQMAVGEETAR